MSDHKFPYHPLTETYPLLRGMEFEELVEAIKLRGQREPVYIWRGSIIDGRNRERACLAAAVKPLYEDVSSLKETDLPDFIDDLNLHRRHLDPAQQRQLRARRVERVARKRQEGRSLRVIAGEEGVCMATVQTDLQTAAVQGYTVDPPEGRVEGRDGKKHPARRRPPEEVADKPVVVPAPVGLILAHEALSCLMRIPEDDPEREAGLRAVVEWIESNR